jgi:23S rRNA (guanosine2251-2'-O)-methyltransferase
MQTRCPYPSCLLVFSPPPSRVALCPGCGRSVSVRPLDVILEIDRRSQDYEVNLKTLDTSKFQIMGLLDDIRSLWNVGSIFRSADGAGVDALFICGITGTPPRKEIAKTSLGAEDHIPWFYSRTTAQLLPVLKQQGVLIVGLEFIDDTSGGGEGRLCDPRPSGSIDLRDAIDAGQITEPVCLCVGNEVAGLSAETLADCDLICHLPMRGFKESLNVAVAFGIAAYQIADGLE